MIEKSHNRTYNDGYMYDFQMQAATVGNLLLHLFLILLYMRGGSKAIPRYFGVLGQIIKWSL